MIFLAIEAVEALHNEQIRRFGGLPSLRDRGLLESADLHGSSTKRAMVLQAASVAITEEEWTSWVRHVAQPRSSTSSAPRI